MSDFAEDRYEPISVSSIPAGWRALYEAPGQEPPWFTLPLCGWAVFHTTVHGSMNGDEPIDAGNVLEGVVMDGGYASCAAAIPGLITYLSPDEPDPKAKQVVRGKGRVPGTRRSSPNGSAARTVNAAKVG